MAKNSVIKERLEAGLEAEIPHLYFNGFVNSSGSGDVVTILEQNGKPVATLNMSFTVAKTLAIKLRDTIARLEQQMDREILTTDDVTETMKKQSGEDV